VVDLQRADRDGDRQHPGEPLHLLLDATKALTSGRVVAEEALDDLQMHDGGVQRTAQIVEQPVEVGG
jgi:hypothetical protein